MRLLEGVVIDGRYTLLRRLGSGGMADVWCAQDSQLGRVVAIKVLHENFARDSEFVERFRREASAAAGLQHPNVVAVFDRGRVEDTYYIAMEYVDGTSLRELIARGLTVTESIEVTRQVLSAAEFAHANGIVHRDLKPLNVLIDRQGRIRVTDFGIASAAGSDITRTGSVMGTAEYLSPEQAQGQPVTAAADIYSIGAMLFEMLTGRVPFEGESPVAIAMKQVTEQPPAPSSLNPNVSPALDAVVLRALAKEPVNRFGSAAEMHAALDAAEADPMGAGWVPPPPPVEEARGTRWWIWALALLAVLLAGGGLAYALTRDGDGGAAKVKVPGVVDKQEQEATDRLESAGFVVEVDRETANQPEGTVTDQDPKGGTEAEKGSTVTITVSKGPPLNTVPDVVGLPRKEARQALQAEGFEVKVSKRFDDKVAAGIVISTSPAAGGRLEEGKAVTMVVSEGTESVTVPDVVGLDRFDAKSQLEGLGFKVDQESENSDRPANEVTRQIPGANESKPQGSTVTIVYSNGKGSIVLEDYIGEKQGYAERRLRKLDLEPVVITQSVSDQSQDGRVISQSPDPGTQMKPGDRVRLTVGEYTPSSSSSATAGESTTGSSA